MSIRQLPSPELMRQLLRYEAETGKFFWLPRPREMFSSYRIFKSWNAKLAGKEAFSTKHIDGYLTGTVLSLNILSHRVAWCLYHGYWPENVDHVNLNKADNRIINLREANKSENGYNTPLSIRNTSGVKGVCWNKRERKWNARIRAMRKTIYLGDFSTIEEAAAAYAEASKTYHGEFGRTE